MALRSGDITIPARDGYPLAATLYVPERGNGVSVLINSATTVPRGYYTKFASFLCARGFTALTYDFRETGGSVERSWRGRPASYSSWAEEDMAGAIEWLAAQYPRNELVCVGHSAGSAIFGMVPNSDRVAAHLGVAAPANHWRHWGGDNVYHRRRMWLLCHVLFPLVTPVLGYYPGWLFGSGRWPKGVALEWARWARHREFFVDEQGRSLREVFHRYRGQMRFYSFSDDYDVAPPKAVAQVADFFGRADVEVLYRKPQDYNVEAVGHLGFFRSFMQHAWQEAADWLHPSGRRREPAASSR